MSRILVAKCNFTYSAVNYVEGQEITDPDLVIAISADSTAQLCVVDTIVHNKVNIFETSSQSEPVILKPSENVVRIIMPSAWDTATITFLVSNNGGETYTSLYDGEGNEYEIAADVDRTILLDPSVFSTIKHFKIQSGTSSIPVAQTAMRILELGIEYEGG